MNVEDVAQELYGLGLKEFTKTRNDRVAEARDAGDRELSQQIKALKKPAKAAWVLNMLARHHAEEIHQLLSIGEKLRFAQQKLDGDQLRQLDRKRRQLTSAVTLQGKVLASSLGESISKAVSAEVEETLRAAMADPSGATAVSSGLLVDTFDATGLEPVNLTDVVALPSAAHAPRRDEKAQRATSPSNDERAKIEHKRKEALRRLKEAQAALLQTESDAEEAHRKVSEAATRREDLQNARKQLQRRLEDLEHEISTVERKLRIADREENAAKQDENNQHRKREEARRAADLAQESLDRLS